MTTSQDPQKIIIPPTIKSSQRILEQIEQREREKELREADELGMLVRGVEKAPHIQREVILQTPLSRGAETLANIEAIKRGKEIAAMKSTSTEDFELTRGPYEKDPLEEPEVIEEKSIEIKSKPLQVERLSGGSGRVFLRGLSAAGREIGRGISRAARSQRTRQALQKSAQVAEQTARSTGRTAGKIGGTTKGVVYVAGKRIEERTFDRPRSQKPLFRPLEAGERRALGLPVPSILSREELRAIALGLTPTSVVKEKQRRVSEIENRIRSLDRQLPSKEELVDNKDKITEEYKQWAALSGPEAQELAQEKRLLLDLASKALRERYRIDEAIAQLSQEKLDIERQDTKIPATIRAAAFSRATKLSPGIGGVMPPVSSRPVGSTRFSDEPKRIRGQKRMPTEEELETDIVLNSLKDM